MMPLSRARSRALIRFGVASIRPRSRPNESETSRHFAPVAHGQLVDAPVGDHRDDGAESLRQVQNRHQMITISGQRGRHVDCRAVVAVDQRGSHGFRDLDRHFSLSVVRRGAQVRCHDQVRGIPERVVGGQRLPVEDVDGGACQPAFLQRLRKSALVHDSPAGRIDQDRRRLQHADAPRVHQPRRFPRQRNMQGHVVGARQHIFELEQLDGQVGGPIGRHVGISHHHSHAERPGAQDDFRPDATCADHAKGFPRELRPVERLTIPLSIAHGSVRRRYATRRRQEESESEFRRRDGVAGGSVQHGHALPGRRVHVDIVEADAGPTDHAQRLPGRDELGIRLRAAPDDQAGGSREGLFQLGPRTAGVILHLQGLIRRQDGDPIRREGIRQHEPRTDPHHATDVPRLTERTRDGRQSDRRARPGGPRARAACDRPCARSGASIP